MIETRPARKPARGLRIAIMLSWLTLTACGNDDSGANAGSASDDPCLVASGGAAAACVREYVAALSACRNEADAACEAALRVRGGPLATLLAATEEPVRANCTAEAADKLTFLLGIDDLVARTAEACRKWGEDVVAVIYATDLAGRAPDELACQRVVGSQLNDLHDMAVREYGENCYAAEFNGQRCDRRQRDRQLGQAKTEARTQIENGCGASFDRLDLVPLTASATLTGRIDALADIVISHARHLAQRVYPPLNLGPTGLFGPAPVGVRTFDLVDPSRLNVAGNGPRPIKVEVFYPSTPDAVAGMPRDVIRIPGTSTSLFTTPTHRDVARASGMSPLVLFSGGQASDVWQFVYLASHLASHGFVVASVEHHGATFFDQSDTDSTVNRPLDIRFVLDQLLAFNGEPGNFFEGAIDADRIGGAGHSFGGYTVMSLATCPFAAGAFTDPRVKAILPIDPGVTAFLSEQSPDIFSTITIPTLLVGGTLSRFAPVPPFVFDAFAPGPMVMDFADLIDADHGTFTDSCEIPDRIRELMGGRTPSCEPETIAWRYSRHITNYLALNFFDATLNDNDEALARLDPSTLATKVEDLTYESKAGDCPKGQSCSLTCAEAACGNGFVGPSEVCDPSGEQGECGAAELCNSNCTACVDCGTATVIAADGGMVVGTTVGGSSTLGSSCGSDIIAPERLFQWTPSVSHVATIETCGGTTDFDTTLYLREGNCLGSDLACNDDACGSQSRITLPVIAGTTYSIVVDGFVVDQGDFTLSVR